MTNIKEYNLYYINSDGIMEHRRGFMTPNLSNTTGFGAAMMSIMYELGENDTPRLRHYPMDPQDYPVVISEQRLIRFGKQLQEFRYQLVVINDTDDSFKTFTQTCGVFTAELVKDHCEVQAIKTICDSIGVDATKANIAIPPVQSQSYVIPISFRGDGLLISE